MPAGTFEPKGNIWHWGQLKVGNGSAIQVNWMYVSHTGEAVADQLRIGSRHGRASARTQPKAELASWPDIDEAALPDKRRSIFLRKKKAISLCVDGATGAEILSATGLSIPTVYKLLVNRCLLQHEDGTVMGWRGAIPHKRTSPYTRKTSIKVQPTGGGTSGALGWLFASPAGADLQVRFRKQILKTSHVLCPPVEGSHGDTLEVTYARLCQLKGLFRAGSAKPQIRYLSVGNTASPLKSNIWETTWCQLKVQK